MASVYVRNASGRVCLVNEADYNEFIEKQPMVRNIKTGRLEAGGVGLEPDSPEVIAYLKEKKVLGKKMMEAQAKIDMAGSPVLKATGAVISQIIKDSQSNQNTSEKTERKTKSKTDE